MSTAHHRPTCTAPALPTMTDAGEDRITGDAAGWTEIYPDLLCSAALPPAACQGTEWPPPTSWERWAAERRDGSRIPPSVSTWRPEDAARQREADRYARSQAPAQEPRVLPWGPGPGCEGRDR